LEPAKTAKDGKDPKSEQAIFYKKMGMGRFETCPCMNSRENNGRFPGCL